MSFKTLNEDFQLINNRLNHLEKERQRNDNNHQNIIDQIPIKMTQFQTDQSESIMPSHQINIQKHDDFRKLSNQNESELSEFIKKKS